MSSFVNILLISFAYFFSIEILVFFILMIYKCTLYIKGVNTLLYLLQMFFPHIITLLIFFFKFIYLFIYFWLCWVFVSVRGLSPVAASGGHSSSRCTGLSLSRPLLLRSTDSRRTGSAIVAHGPSRSAACGILPDQGSNPCPLHWQADSQPLRHQGSPTFNFLCCLSVIERLKKSGHI